MTEVVLLPNDSLCAWEMGDPSLGFPLSQELEFPAATALSLTGEEVSTCSRAHVGSVMEPGSVGTHVFLSHLPPSSPPRAECGSAVHCTGGLEVTVASMCLQQQLKGAWQGNLICVVILGTRVSWLPALPLSAVASSPEGDCG